MVRAGSLLVLPVTLAGGTRRTAPGEAGGPGHQPGRQLSWDPAVTPEMGHECVGSSQGHVTFT